MHRTKRAMATLLAVLLGALCLGCTAREEAGTAPAATPKAVQQDPIAGNVAPSMALWTADGQSVTLESFYGKPVIVNFWASWCGVCRAEMPFFQAAYDAYKDDEITFLMVDVLDEVQETREEAEALLKEKEITMPVYYTQNARQASQAYWLTGLPVTMILGADGTILERHVGLMTPAQLEETIPRLLDGTFEVVME